MSKREYKESEQDDSPDDDAEEDETGMAPKGHHMRTKTPDEKSSMVSTVYAPTMKREY